MCAGDDAVKKNVCGKALFSLLDSRTQKPGEAVKALSGLNYNTVTTLNPYLAE